MDDTESQNGEIYQVLSRALTHIRTIMYTVYNKQVALSLVVSVVNPSTRGF